MTIYSLGDRKVALPDGDCFVAGNATVIGSVTLGSEASVWFNVVVRGDSEIIALGERCNVQDGSVLHADPGFPLTLERNVSVGHMATLHGCSVGEGSLIGINSVILNGAVIGRSTLVGAGTLIPEGKRFPDGVLVLGSPGKVVRELTAEEKDGLLRIAEGYVQRAALYREQLKSK